MYEELSIVLGLLVFLFVSPLLHEVFHQLALEAFSCPYRQEVSIGFHISAKTEPLCDLGRMEWIMFMISGVAGSLAVSQLLFLISLRLGRFFGLPLLASSSAILLSNAVSLLSPESDLSFISPELSWMAGALLALLAVAEFMAGEKLISKESEVYSVVE